MFTDRLRELRYVSPTGQDFTLNFNSLSRGNDKKAPVTEFADQDQGSVQDLGETTSRFSIDCYLSGPDYDLEADRFFKALSEKGSGTLYHPRWGNRNVLPISKSQSEAYVEGAGVALFSITFVQTDDDVFNYPTATTDPDDQISALFDIQETAILEAVPEEVTDPSDLEVLQSYYETATDGIKDTFNTLAGLTDDVRDTIADVVNTIETEISDLVAAPADLMTSLLQLYRAPAREAIDIQTKIETYETIYDDLISGFISTTTQYGETFGIVAIANLAAINAAACEATIDGDILTRRESVDIVDRLKDLIDNILNSIIEIEEAGTFNSDYEMNKAFQDISSATLTNLIDRSLSLPTERTLILEKETTPIQLVYELYGDLTRLEQFILYNELKGDSIILLYPGAEVRYFD